MEKNAAANHGRHSQKASNPVDLGLIHHTHPYKYVQHKVKSPLQGRARRAKGGGENGE